MRPEQASAAAPAPPRLTKALAAALVVVLTGVTACQDEAAWRAAGAHSARHTPSQAQPQAVPRPLA